VERPGPSSNYLNFCRHLLRWSGLERRDSHRSTQAGLANAKPLPRRSLKQMEGKDLSCGACIVSGMQAGWKARDLWDLDWFRKNLGARRQLVKWQGPIFTRKEKLWECPIWETSVAEYLDYIQMLSAVDPSCEERNAAELPRLYLNGWSAFQQLPWLREYVVNTRAIGDISGDLLAECEELREGFLQSLTKGYKAPPEEMRMKGIEDDYWDMTKIFIQPRGAITRLHFDNGGAHGWLSQVRGRKLHICFSPSDSANLCPFEGDEALPNGSWIDPLDPDAFERWPDYEKATPYVGVVDEGETLVVPQGWWHYTVALDPGITVMRNFYDVSNKRELLKRKDEALGDAVGMFVLKQQTKLKNQPDAMLKEIGRKTVQRIREDMEKQQSGQPGYDQARHSRCPNPGGVPAPKASSASRS